MKKVAVLLSLVAFLMVSCTKSDQEAQVSNVSSTPCQQTKAATNELQDRVDVAFTGEGVKITYFNFEVTCDFEKVDVTHSFVSGVLKITQQGTPNEAKCICYTDVSYTIKGISKNEVNVIFINGKQVYCHNGTIPQPNIKEGVYSGTYIPIWSSIAVGRKVTLELKNGRFVCTDFSEELPSANGAGTYSIKYDTVIFIDEWIRFGMPLYDAILVGKFNYAFDGKRLKFSNGRYIFDLELVDTGRCDKDVIISADEFENAPNDHVSINDMRIEGNCLKIKFSAGGCDGSNWIVKLIDAGIVAESLPEQRRLRLSLDINGEYCKALITKEMSFNIEDLQIRKPGSVILHVSEKSILYEY